MSQKYGNGTRRMEADGWNWRSISNIILLENGSHRKRYLESRSAIVYRCFQNSFASASYTKEKASPFRSLVEKCDRIYDPRIDHPWLYTGKISVKHRDEIYVSRYFSFIRGTRHDDSLKIIERKREREGEYQVIEGQPIFEYRAFFNLHNVSFREIPQSRIRLFVTRVQFL